MKLERLLVHACLRAGFGGVSRAGARQAGLDIDIDENCEIGFEAAAGYAIERQHSLRSQAAAAALIRQAGIGEAVRQYDFAAAERGHDELVDVLGAGGEIE